MKIIYIFIYCLFLFECVIASNVNPAFETERIKDTYNLFPNDLKTIIDKIQYKDTLINGNIIIPKSKLCILYNTDKEISHIGFNINKSKINYDYLEAYQFIENFLLNLSLDTKNYYLVEFATQNDIKIYNNKTLVIPDVKNIKLLVTELLNSEFNLIYESPVFQAVWTTKSNDKLTITFPANLNLVKGMLKSDLEKDFIRKFKTYTKEKKYLSNNMSKIEPSHDGLYIIKGVEFETDNFRSDVYFQKNEFNNYLPVYSMQNPVESFSNLFITEIDNTYKIENTFILYGNKKLTVTDSFNQLHSHLSDNNLIFFGLNSYKLNHMHATIIYYNPIYNYTHMLIAETDKQNLFKEKNNFIKSYLYLYIPRVDLIKTIKKVE